MYNIKYRLKINPAQFCVADVFEYISQFQQRRLFVFSSLSLSGIQASDQDYIIMS